MIYTSDDYLTKYIDTFGYIFARSAYENYAFGYVEKVLSYSQIVNELEQSNVTTIAFTSVEKIYADLFPRHANDGFVYNPYDEYGWIGHIYVHIFLKFQITFESIFMLLPIKEALNLYHLYHEMDITQVYDVFEEKMKPSIFAKYMKLRNISSNELSLLTGVSQATISSLRYGTRDINKFEALKLLKISSVLNIKMTSLLTNLSLVIQN